MNNEIKRKDDLHVVIADDDWEDHELIKKALQECEVENTVTSVFNGQQLMDLLFGQGFHKSERKSKPDIIFLDLKMDTMNGFEVLKKMSEDAALKSIPVYVITETDNPQKLKECLSLGARGVYTKPFRFAELSAHIAKVCSDHQK
jgi:two-component system response regulator